MTTDTLTIARCDCGLLVWFGGALAIYQDGVTHRPDPEDCGADQ